MRHEIGHSIGLCHSPYSQLLMYGVYDVAQIKYVDGDAVNGAGCIYNPNYTGPQPSSGCVN